LQNGGIGDGIYPQLPNANGLMDRPAHTAPTLLAFASTRSESFVFVELTEFSTRGKSPVLKEPAPANVLDELLGDKISESPI
jgi:hypothetical protein